MFRLRDLLIICVLLLFNSSLTSCESPSVAPESSAAALLVGRWELIQTDGGLDGRVHPADPTRKQEIVFEASGQAQIILNGATLQTYPYTLTQATTYVSGQPKTFVSAPNINARGQFIERISASNLVLVDDFADGMGFYYTRR